LDICPWTLSVPRTEQFSESIAQGKLGNITWRQYGQLLVRALDLKSRDGEFKFTFRTCREEFMPVLLTESTVKVLFFLSFEVFKLVMIIFLKLFYQLTILGSSNVVNKDCWIFLSVFYVVCLGVCLSLLLHGILIREIK